jgi:hypothetical protein
LGFVDAILPIGVGVLASISSVRHHASRKGERIFWIPVGAALLALSLIVLGLH